MANPEPSPAHFVFIVNTRVSCPWNVCYDLLTRVEYEQGSGSWASPGEPPRPVPHPIPSPARHRPSTPSLMTSSPSSSPCPPPIAWPVSGTTWCSSSTCTSDGECSVSEACCQVDFHHSRRCAAGHPVGKDTVCNGLCVLPRLAFWLPVVGGWKRLFCLSV